MLNFISIFANNKISYKLDDFNIFIRPNIREVINFIFHECQQRINLLEKYKLYILNVDNLKDYRIAIYIDKNIVMLIGHTLFLHEGKKNTIIGIIRNSIIIDNLDNYLLEINSNLKEDKFDKINEHINDAKDIMIENIEKIILREEKLQDLLEKTKNLSSTSKSFLKKAKNLNKCCTLL